ncbi:MAG: hypothetical protein EAZ40_18165, partial [Rhodobacterales bacterium]
CSAQVLDFLAGDPQTHSGAIVGSDDVFDAALRRAGAVRVRSFVELFSAAKCLASRYRPVGKRLAIVTNGGGPGVLAAEDFAHMLNVKPGCYAFIGNGDGAVWELSLATMRELPQLASMRVLQRGNRLSITPVTDTTAQVRFTKTWVSDGEGVPDRVGKFTATVTYRFEPSKQTALDLVWQNPTGFLVTDYRITTETLTPQEG